jgi:hypothetical protein
MDGGGFLYENAPQKNKQQEKTTTEQKGMIYTEENQMYN